MQSIDFCARRVHKFDTHQGGPVECKKLRRRVGTPIRRCSFDSEFSRTSLTRCKDYYAYPNPKLRGCDNPKANRDGNVCHRHGVYPVITFSQINQNSLNLNEKDSRPGSQHHLCNNVANGAHQCGVERGHGASVLIGT